MINVGYIENVCANGDLRVRIYYDKDQPAGPGQPLVNGPRGFCLDVTNKTGRRATATFTSGLQTITTAIQQGDPVTTGPTAGRSRTALEMALLGFTTRGDVADFALDCPED